MLDYLDLGGLRLHDDIVTIPIGLTAVDGLVGPPGIRGEAYDRPEEDGAVEPALQVYPARLITLEGECWGVDAASAWASWRTVAAAIHAVKNADGLLKSRRSGGVDVQYTVKLAGAVGPKLTELGPVLPFQLTLRASDPYAYSQTEKGAQVSAPAAGGSFPFPLVFPLTMGGVSAGSVSVRNDGDADTWPRLTVTGPIVNPVLVDAASGKSLIFDGLTLADGATLTVNMNPASRYATVAGANAMGSLRWSDSDFFSMPAGVGTFQFFGQGGGYGANTKLSVAWRDAYIS